MAWQTNFEEAKENLWKNPTRFFIAYAITYTAIKAAAMEALKKGLFSFKSLCCASHPLQER